MATLMVLNLARLFVVAIAVGAAAASASMMLRVAWPWWGWIVGALWVALALAFAAAALRRPKAALWTALAAAAALRLAAAAGMGWLEGVETGNDYAAYLALPRHLLAGQGLWAHTENFGWVTGLYPPLYPLILAGAGAVGGIGIGTVLVVNSVIDLAAAAVLGALGRQVREPEAGRIGAILYLLWPGFVLAAPLAQKESLAGLIVLLLTWLILRFAEEGPAWRTAIPAGCAGAALALTQPSLIMIPTLAALVLLPRVGFAPLLRFAVRAAPVAIVLMLPWWIRNWMVFGEFVPLTTSLGPTMSVAAFGDIVPVDARTAAMAEPERSSFYARQAIAVFVEEPGRIVAERLRGLVRILAYEQETALRLSRFRPAVDWAAALIPAGQLAYLAVAATAAWTAVRARTAAARQLAPFFFAALVQLGFVQLWFQSAERHRQFLVPFLLLLAAVALVRWINPIDRTIRAPDADRAE